MSHKKANLTSNVPFSWEKMPGVPKFMASPIYSASRDVHKKVLPLPPGDFRVPARSASKRMFWSEEEDPFLAALKECSKDSDSYKAKNEIKKRLGRRAWTSKSILSSCKHSFDVKEGNLVMMRPSSLGSILRPE